MSQLQLPSDQTSRIPLTVISGPPQAGKSTLVRHLLGGTTGHRLAAVVSDERAIDPSMIVKRDGDLLTLRNGCLCRITEDDVATTLASLSRQTPRPAHVVVDVDGWTDPRRLAGYGYMPGYCFDGTIAVLDASGVQAALGDPAAESRLHAQVNGASLILLNKVDLAGEQETEQAHRLIQRMSHTARVVCADHARIAPPLLVGFGDGPGSLDDEVMFFPWSAEYWPGRTRDTRSPHEGLRPRGERHRAWCLTSDEPVPAHAFRSWAQQMPASILRARGCVHLSEEPSHRQEFHLFGSHWRLERGAPWGDDARATRVLLAGLGAGRHTSTEVGGRTRASSGKAAVRGDAA